MFGPRPLAALVPRVFHSLRNTFFVDSETLLVYVATPLLVALGDWDTPQCRNGLCCALAPLPAQHAGLLRTSVLIVACGK